MSGFRPGYLALLETGELEKRVETARKRLSSCTLCPRKCGVDRAREEKGFCRTGSRAVVASYGPHFGEESPLVGSFGSGTVFFSFCNLLCLFCQNYGISHQGEGQEADPDEIAAVFLSLQETGCPNINLVTPSHVVPQILEAVLIAAQNGLDVPLVYNTGGYDEVETLRLLDGVVDIYMPDIKFLTPETAQAACQAPDYPDKVRAALTEMHRQTGDLVINENGLARKGLLVRHLVLPGGLADTYEAMDFLAQKISKNTYVNVMPQYRPLGRAFEVPGLEFPLSHADFEIALKQTHKAGITRLDHRKRTFLAR